ncbi:MAG: DUF2058 domain-containing protein [Gammaproteobacteria bacterium]|nr:DUF2058 domain-containing protein [Gammaproteobacteria bacterium]
MGNSLFEQLKKTGLVDDKKAKQAKHSQYKNKKQKSKKGAPTQVDEATLLAQKTHAEKVERDRQLNQAKKTEAGHKAITAQIKQLIETNRIEDGGGDVVYNFTDANVVKHLYISEQTHTHLIAGRLAIAKLGDTYELVPVPVAEKIKQRDEQCIILCGPSTRVESSREDPYADYKIPDDLMW